MKNMLKLFSAATLMVSLPALAGSFTLSSNDIAQGEFMDKQQEFGGFGCSGEDLSPHLKWSNAPEGTKSFAITAYDPDAPTGSGWWHWQVVNIAANVTETANEVCGGNARGCVDERGAAAYGGSHASNESGGPVMQIAAAPYGPEDG